MSLKRGLLRVLATFSCFLSATPIQLHPVERPITWNVISECYANDIPAGTTFRSMQGEQIYGLWKAQMKAKNTTFPQFIKNKILGFGKDPQKPVFHIKSSIIEEEQVQIYTTGERDYLGQFEKNSEYFKRSKGVQQESKFILLTINNFPYDLEPGVHHWVIWCNKAYPMSIIEEVLRDVMKEDVEWQLYQNPAHLKSIPEISHYQMFIRKNPLSDKQDESSGSSDL